MEDSLGTHNKVSGEIRGSIVQARSIQQVVVGGLPRVVAPRQLPLAVRNFTGRADQIAALEALIPADDGGDSSDTVALVIVDGVAGVGKTTLVVHWAHRAQHRFPDGTLYANLGGYGPDEPAVPGEVLEGFLRALGTPAEHVPAGLEARAGLYRSLLAGRRMLIMLDNARSADQVRPLLSGSPGCFVVVTSRDSLSGLVVNESAHRLTLDPFTETEALDLVVAILDLRPDEQGSSAINELIRLCARLPLALRIAVSRASAPHATVSEVVTELSDERSRLEVLSHGRDERTAVRAVFGWSYSRLAPEQARMFRRLGLHPGPEISAHAAAALTGDTPRRARRTVEGLADGHLIEPSAGGRYRFHDLLRTYAAELAYNHDSAAVREDALTGLLAWYAHTAAVCDEMVHPGQRSLPRPATPPRHPTMISDRAEAAAWLDAEEANLFSALRHADDHSLEHHALSLAFASRFLGMRSRDKELTAADIGLRAARYCGDPAAESWFHSQRGLALTGSLRWNEARESFGLSGTIARQIGDLTQYAFVLNGLGVVALAQERFAEAATYLLEALPMVCGVDTGRMEAMVEGNLSQACLGLGEYQRAFDHGERGLALRQRCGDVDGEAAALHHLARVLHGLGEYQRAIELCRRAISRGRNGGYLTVTVAAPLTTLADCLLKSGYAAEAVACWREAATIYDEHGQPDSAARIRRRLSDGLVE